MTRIATSLVVLFVILAPVRTAQSVETDPAKAIGAVNDICTGNMISPHTLQVASHCVGDVESEVDIVFYRGTHTETKIKGTVVWDGLAIKHGGGRVYADHHDLAFVRIETAWPHTLPFYQGTPIFPVVGRNISMAIGINYWDVPLTVVGQFIHDDLGWILVYRGDSLPGASGSAVLVDGKIVGIITHGTNFVQPPLLMGSPAWRIRFALRDYEQVGAMVNCQIKVPGEKEPRDSVCRKAQ